MAEKIKLTRASCLIYVEILEYQKQNIMLSVFSSHYYGGDDKRDINLKQQRMIRDLIAHHTRMLLLYHKMLQKLDTNGNHKIREAYTNNAIKAQEAITCLLYSVH